MDKLTILLIEDDTLLRSALAGELRFSNFNVLEAENGKEGLAVALAKHPDLILLDVAMPVLDGISVMRRLREDVWGKIVKIIMLTSLSSSDFMMSEIMKGEPSYYLQKNTTDLGIVLSKVREVLAVSA